MAETVLTISNLRVGIDTPRGTAYPVDGVDFELHLGETLALVGESGCGKSMTALALMQLIPEPAGFIESGEALMDGQDLFDLTWEEMRLRRGKSLAMIFQEPMTSLDPTFSIGWTMKEALRVHGNQDDSLIETALKRVGLDDVGRVLRSYPHELSGGMRQRIMIALALLHRPSVLIADEPTTALDVTVQAQILQLLKELHRQDGMAILLITHDLAVVSGNAKRVAVMYAGQIVEIGSVEEVFHQPRHPYTRGLLAGRPSRDSRGQKLGVIEGVVPGPTAWPTGCRFADRCPSRMDACSASIQMKSAHRDGLVRCILEDV
ncbi:MAG: ABC transporter ATP-binding protein [Chthonomonadales bacterium]